MHKKWLKISHKNAIKLTKIVHIAQMDSNRIRILWLKMQKGSI